MIIHDPFIIYLYLFILHAYPQLVASPSIRNLSFRSPGWAPGACGTCACGTWPQGQERPAQAAERGKKFHNVFSMGKHEVSEYVNGLGKVLNYGKLVNCEKNTGCYTIFNHGMEWGKLRCTTKVDQFRIFVVNGVPG